MFKKFSVRENVSGQSQVKNSVAREIRNSILQQMPKIEPFIDDILPKKVPTVIAKCQNHLNLVVVK